MKSHCWRNPRLEGKKEKDKAWPELQSENQIRKNDSQTRVRQSSQNIANDQSESCNQLVANLDHCDYPELGGRMSRRKNYPGKDSEAIVEENVIILHEKSVVNTITKKYVKRSKRTNLIRINIQQALENQKSLKNSLTEKKIKCCDRIVEAKRNKIYLSKVKRPSKLKQIITSEREKQREIRDREKKVEPTIEDCEINIGKLKIVPDPELDFDYARNFSTLNLIGNEYRDSRDESLVDGVLENEKDVTQKLENLLISTNEEINLVEDDLRHDIANLQIDGLEFQVGIRLENVSKTLILRNEEYPILQNCTAQNFRENETELRYSRKFREYCTNIIATSLNENLEIFLSELFRLQRKLYDRDNVKGRYKRRYYTGFNEVEKHVNLRKIRFVIIVPDLEKIQVEGGLDDTVNKLIGSCRKQDIPICFGLSRRKLGYLTHRKGFVSCIGISNFSGTEEKLEQVLNNLVEAKNEFRKLKGEFNKVMDIKKIMVEDLLLSERVNMLLRIISSTT